MTPGRPPPRSSGDERYACTSERLPRLRPPLLTGGNPAAVPMLVDTGVLGIAFSVQQLAALMRRYAQVPMSLTDACLVRMTELIDDAVVLTFDADFRVYRKQGREVMPLVAPEGV